MEPRIVELPALKLAGLPYYGEPTDGNFSKAWHRLMQESVPPGFRVDERIAYGVELYGPEFHQEHKWMYFPSFEVTDLQETPGNLFVKKLPASKYAVFHITGRLEKIHETFMYAYGTWLPASNYEVAYPFDSEYYGVDFKGDAPESEMDIYIPVKEKAA